MSKKSKEKNKKAPGGELKQVAGAPKAVPTDQQYKYFVGLINQKPKPNQKLIERWLANYPGFDMGYLVNGKSLSTHAYESKDFAVLNTIIGAQVEYSPEIKIEFIPGTSFTFAQCAAANNGLDLLRKLLIHRPQDFLQPISGKKHTLLHFAVQNPANSVELIRFLVQDAKVDIEAQSYQGRTAAFFAAEVGNLVALQELHRLGADLAFTDPWGKNLRAIAIKMGKQNVIPFLNEILAQSQDPVTCFYQAIDEGNLPVVKHWRKEIKDLNQHYEFKNPSGKTTALGRATGRAYPEVVNYLLEQKANVNAGTEDGVTPLMDAVYNGDNPMVKRLLQANADPNAVNTYGQSVLQLSVIVDKSSAETTSILLEAKADVNYARSQDGITALHLAVKKRRPLTINTLLTHPNTGINPNLRTDEGDTALLHAVRHGYMNETKALLQSSAVDKECASYLGNPVTFLALRLKGDACFEMLRLLLTAGVSANQVFQGGRGLYPFSLGLAVLLQGAAKEWQLLKRYKVNLQLDQEIVLYTAMSSGSPLVKDAIQTFLPDLAFDPIRVAYDAVDFGYFDVIPILRPLLPEIKLPPQKSWTQENLKESIRTFVIERGTKKTGTELTSSASSDQDRDQQRDLKLTQGISGRRFLKESGRSAEEIDELLRQSSSDEEAKQKSFSTSEIVSSSSLWGGVKPCTWFNGKLQSSQASTTAQLKPILRGNVPNCFLYIDPSLSPEAYPDPAIQALLKKDKWAFDPKNGLKPVEGEMETHYVLSVAGSEAKALKVDITYEIATRRDIAKHDRILLFCIPADKGGRGALYVATAALVLKGGLGGAYTPSKHVKVTLPETLLSSALKIS